MTPSEAAAAMRRLSRSSRSPRCATAPLAVSAAAPPSDRARPVTSCPASRSSSTTAEPMCPVAPVTKTCMEDPFWSPEDVCLQVNGGPGRGSKSYFRWRDAAFASPLLINAAWMRYAACRSYDARMTDSAPTVLDLDLRLVGYFVVVAEHRHFGRAATALRVAQPSLSRQIRRLEQQLGIRLLDRTPQGTRLTEAGEVFLPRAKARLRSAVQAAAQARAAAQPSRIVIGYTAGLIITPAVRELRREHPDAEVQALHLDWDQARHALLDHRVDAVVTRLPFPTDQLHVTVLYDEPRVLAVPIDHRLAGR